MNVQQDWVWKDQTTNICKLAAAMEIDAERNGETAKYSGPIPQIAFDDIMLGFNVHCTSCKLGRNPRSSSRTVAMRHVSLHESSILYFFDINSCGIKVDTIELRYCNTCVNGLSV